MGYAAKGASQYIVKKKIHDIAQVQVVVLYTCDS